jgi:hypothetical protein
MSQWWCHCEARRAAAIPVNRGSLKSGAIYRDEGDKGDKNLSPKPKVQRPRERCYLECEMWNLEFSFALSHSSLLSLLIIDFKF